MSTIEWDHMLTRFYYLATPYSKAVNLDAAAAEAARITGCLINRGHHIYSPIVHGHAIEQFVDANARDSAFWVRLQRPFIDAAVGIYIATMPGWQQSSGIASELNFFIQAKKPTSLIDPIKLNIIPVHSWEITDGLIIMKGL